jgi:hypothetical protein
VEQLLFIWVYTCAAKQEIDDPYWTSMFSMDQQGLGFLVVEVTRNQKWIHRAVDREF